RLRRAATHPSFDLPLYREQTSFRSRRQEPDSLRCTYFCPEHTGLIFILWSLPIPRCCRTVACWDHLRALDPYMTKGSALSTSSMRALRASGTSLALARPPRATV